MDAAKRKGPTELHLYNRYFNNQEMGEGAL